MTSPIEVLVWHGSIGDADADVLVNASNTILRLGSGVSYAIGQSCGPGFQAVLDALPADFTSGLPAVRGPTNDRDGATLGDRCAPERASATVGVELALSDAGAARPGSGAEPRGTEHHELVLAVHAVMMRVIEGWYRTQGKALGIEDGRTRSITVVQRSGATSR